MICSTIVTWAFAMPEGVPAPLCMTETALVQMVSHAGPVVKAIMAGLAALSILCWGIIASKARLIRKMRKESRFFLQLFKQRQSYKALYEDCRELEESHLAHLFRTGYGELSRMEVALDNKRLQGTRVNPRFLLETVGSAMESEVMTERERCERFLPVLATTGSTAPFIGLFGTVWGIMTSFQDIGVRGSANLAVVAPGISEALVATAIGLAAAIPAVVFYNHFSNQIRKLENEMMHFSTDFLNHLKRDLMLRNRRAEVTPVQPLAAEAS